jgi:hypothetical protein
MKRIHIPTTPFLRAISLVGFVAMTAQLLFLAEPGFAVRIVEQTWDKAVHMVFFATMAFLLWVATAKRWPLIVWLTVVFIGAADESLQAYTPGRTSDFNDWLADGLGAAAVLIIAQRITATGESAGRVASTSGDESCVES